MAGAGKMVPGRRCDRTVRLLHRFLRLFLLWKIKKGREGFDPQRKRGRGSSGHQRGPRRELRGVHNGWHSRETEIYQRDVSQHRRRSHWKFSGHEFRTDGDEADAWQRGGHSSQLSGRG